VCLWFFIATVTVPAGLFVNRLRALERLLPASRYRIDLKKFTCPATVAEFIPASVAYENLVIPLVSRRRELFVAMAEPLVEDTLQKLAFILNRQILPIVADLEDIRAVIGQTYVLGESIDSVLVEFTDPPTFNVTLNPFNTRYDLSQDIPLVRLANLILREAQSQGAERVLISPINGGRIRYLIGGSWLEQDSVPQRLLTPLASRFALMAGVLLEFEQFGRAAGSFNWSIPGGPVLVRVALETLDEGPVVQIDFAGPPRPDF
jgi:type II secretory ATPase GspE/PulE/Tfp pilus assembly ATPase PilB-like protein